MKHTLTILALSAVFMAAFAQSPNKFSYQAVVRNAGGELIINNTVGIRLTIVQGTSNGTEIFSETHTPSTNSNGLFTLEVGTGIASNGTFANINWANGPYFLKNLK